MVIIDWQNPFPNAAQRQHVAGSRLQRHSHPLGITEKLMDDSVKSIVLENLYDLRHRIWAFGEASGYVTSGTYSRYWTWRDFVTAHHGEFWLSFAD
jgi:hypothetical protein